MEKEGLGPNGGVVYALETLEENTDWLRDGLAKLGGRSLMQLKQTTTFCLIVLDKSSYLLTMTH